MDRIKRKILAAVAVHHICNDASVVTLPAIFPVLYTEGVLIRRYSDIGTIILIGLLVAVFFQFWIGHSVKHRHYRRLLAIDALTVGAALLLMTQARNYSMLILCFMGVRMGTSIYHPVGIAWISKTFGGKGLDRAMGLQSAFGDIGVLAAFASTGFLVDHFGWKIPLVIWGCMNAVALITGLTVSRGTLDLRRNEDAEDERVSWKETIGGLKFFVPLIVLGGLAWGVTLNYAPSMLNHRLGISMSRTGLILSCWMAAGTVATLFYGRLSEILGRGRTIIIAYSLIVAAALTLAFSRNVRLTTIVFIVYGLSLFVTYPALLSFVGSTIAERNRTAAFSVVSNLQIIGNSVFAFVSGFISDAFGIHAPFLLLGGVTLLVVVYMSFACRTGLICCAVCTPVGFPDDIVKG